MYAPSAAVITFDEDKELIFKGSVILRFGDVRVDTIRLLVIKLLYVRLLYCKVLDDI